MLPLLYDISIADDSEQPRAKVDFLVDQRSERKCRLPPITGLLGVERRRKERHALEEKRRKKEQDAAAERFETAGKK